MSSSTPPLAIPAPAGRSDWDAWGDEPARLPAGARALVAAVLPGKRAPGPPPPASCAHAVAPRRTATWPRSPPPRAAVSRRPTTTPRCCTSAERALRTCSRGGWSGCRRLRMLSSRPPRTTTCVRPSPSAWSAASPSCRSAAARASSAASTRCRGAYERVIALDLARTAALLDLDETRGSRRSAPAPPALRPRRSSSRAGSRSATSRRASATPRSAGSPPHAPAGRPRAATAASTSWSTRSASRLRPANSTSDAPRRVPPDPISGSSSSGPRARSA